DIAEMALCSFALDLIGDFQRALRMILLSFELPEDDQRRDVRKLVLLREARLFHRLRVVLLRMRNAREEHVRGTEVDLLAETRMLLRFIEPVELEQQRAEP